MGTRRRTATPAPVVLGPFKARVARGPRQDGRYYWRVTEGRAPAGCRWGSRSEIEQDLARRLTGVPEEEVVEAPETVADLVNRWVDLQSGRTDIEERSIRGFRVCGQRIVRVAGSWKIDELPKRAHELRSPDLSKSTIKQDVKVLRRIWRWAEDQGWVSGRIPRVPVAGPPPERITPTRDEAYKVEEHLAGEMRVAHAVLRVTGCRGIAIERLTWNAIELHEITGKIRLIGKGRRVREVPIPGTLVRLLQSHPRKYGERVFRRTICQRLRAHIRNVCEDLGIESYALHGLRRLRVREYRRAGVPVRVAADLLGHTPQVMLSMYDEATEDDKRSALTSLWAKEDGEGSPPTASRTTPGPGSRSTLQASEEDKQS